MAQPPTQNPGRVLVVDAGGKNVKLRLGAHEEIRKVRSGRKLDAAFVGGLRLWGSEKFLICGAGQASQL